MAETKMPNTNNTTTKSPSGEDVLSGAVPIGRPWEDRYKQYLDFLIEKIEGLVAASKREGITEAELVELANNPENVRFKQELEKLLDETAEQFCFRLDGGLHRELLGKNFLGAEEWKRGFNVDVGPVPPIPKWITKELLEDKCQLHPGQQVKDTHILMLVPKTVNGEPYSAVKLGALCAGTKGSGDKLIYDGADWANDWKGEAWAQAAQVESEWVLIPKSDPDLNKVPEDRHFRSKTIAEQADVLKHYEKDYREAKALEVMTAALLNDVVNGEPRMLAPEGDNWNYLRCVEENASGGRVVVGSFFALGLGVGVDDGDDGNVHVGGALAWKSRS